MDLFKFRVYPTSANRSPIVIDSRTLNAGAADSMGNIIQLFTLVPSRNRTFLPGKNPNAMDIQNPLRQQTQGPVNQGMSGIIDAQSQMRQQSHSQSIQGIPGGQYQPLIPLSTMEDGYRNRQQSRQTQPQIAEMVMEGQNRT